MKNKALKEYKLIDGRSFTDDKNEKFIRKIIKLAGKHGWEYNQETKRGKTFCITGGGAKTPKGKLNEEYISITFTWKK